MPSSAIAGESAGAADIWSPRPAGTASALSTAGVPVVPGDTSDAFFDPEKWRSWPREIFEVTFQASSGVAPTMENCSGSPLTEGAAAEVFPSAAGEAVIAAASVALAVVVP